MTTEQFIRDIIPLQPTMRRMAQQLLHDKALADDAVQETLTRRWTKRRKLSRADDPRAYSLRTLRNHCIDILRKQRPTLDPATLADSLADVAQTDEAEQRYQQLDRAIATLTPLQQQLINLKYTQGLTTRQIADLTGLTPSNIDTIMSRTYAQIKHKMQ